MKTLSFDIGIREFQIEGAGVLRFNPSDFNVYNRFISAKDEIQKVEDELVAKGTALGDNPDGSDVIKLMREADLRVKGILTDVFGAQNDFDEILNGVNLMAVSSNGERVITNFLAALAPVMQDGLRSLAKNDAEAAKSGPNRAQRRAQARKNKRARKNK